MFTGGRSLHFHFVFSTEHFLHAPFDLNAADRLKADWLSQSALMHNVHTAYWDRAYASLCNIVEPSCPTDRKLRSVTQWRRAPWGIRVLEKDALILGLSKGMQIPQLVLRERIRTKAPRNSSEYAVLPEFNLFSRLPGRAAKSTDNLEASDLPTNGQAMLGMLQEICAAEWGSEYPKPASIRLQNGEWLINFYNHAQDRHPSTIALGHYRKLLLAGKHFYSHEFFLPDQMAAQELGDHVYTRCGGHVAPPPVPQLSQRKCDQAETSNHPPQCWLTIMANSLCNGVDITQPRDELVQSYRHRFSKIINNLRIFSNHSIIRTVEGFGKTTAHFPLIADETFDAAIASYRNESIIQRFGCFAFRSHEQACQKAAECREKGHRAVVVRSFRRIYEAACSELGEHPLPAYFFPDASRME